MVAVSATAAIWAAAVVWWLVLCGIVSREARAEARRREARQRQLERLKQ